MSEHRRILHDIHVLEQNIAHNYAELHRMRSINSRGGTISKRAFQEVESTIRQQETLLDGLVNTLNQVFDSELPEIPSYEEFRGGMQPAGTPPRRPPTHHGRAPERLPPRAHLRPKPTLKELQYRELHGKWPASYSKKIESYIALPLHLAESEQTIKTFPPPPSPPASTTGGRKRKMKGGNLEGLRTIRLRVGNAGTTQNTMRQTIQAQGYGAQFHGIIDNLNGDIPITRQQQVAILNRLHQISPNHFPAVQPPNAQHVQEFIQGLHQQQQHQQQQHAIAQMLLNYANQHQDEDPQNPPPQGDGKKIRFVKRYLKGQGKKATKHNIKKIMDAMDSEGVVFL